MNRIILKNKRIQYVNKNKSLSTLYKIEYDISQRIGSYVGFGS
jgi:hypothetical protein